MNRDEFGCFVRREKREVSVLTRRLEVKLAAGAACNIAAFVRARNKTASVATVTAHVLRAFFSPLQRRGLRRVRLRCQRLRSIQIENDLGIKHFVQNSCRGHLYLIACVHDSMGLERAVNEAFEVQKQAFVSYCGHKSARKPWRRKWS